ncbi:unnamed protein product [Withania somnifera]
MREPKLVYLSMLLFCTFLAIDGHIGDFDEVWRRRAQEADEWALKAYKPDPMNVTFAFAKQTREITKEIKEAKLATNGTRRGLRGKRSKYNGPCLVTNPIDRCWRCQADWADNRKRHHRSNPKPGTLRYGVIQKEPLWIIFAQSMNIRLTQELIMQSDKTIDGRGVNVHIANGADAVDHIGQRTQSDGDGRSIFGSSNIWVDHVSMWRCYDGLVDAVEGSTAVTISNSHFTDHNEVMLFGAGDSSSIDQRMQITVAFNHFGKRLYRECQGVDGVLFMLLIMTTHTGICMLLVVTKRDYSPESVWKQWPWRSQGDLFMNGAFFVESGDPDWTKKYTDLFDGISPAPGDKVTWITRFSGALNFKPGVAC